MFASSTTTQQGRRSSTNIYNAEKVDGVTEIHDAAKNPGRPGSGEVFFNSVPDDYIGAVHKLRAIIRFASKREYDLLVKVDDDTFVSREMLADLFSNPDDAYVGHPAPSGVDQLYNLGGAYRLNRDAMSILADASIPEKIGRKSNGTPTVPEDIWVGDSLRAHGVSPVLNSKYAGFMRGCEELASGLRDMASVPPLYKLYWSLVEKTLRPVRASNHRSDFQTEEEFQAGLDKWKHLNLLVPLPHFNCDAEKMRCFYALDGGMSEAEFLATKPHSDMLRLFELLRHVSVLA